MPTTTQPVTSTVGEKHVSEQAQVWRNYGKPNQEWVGFFYSFEVAVEWVKGQADAKRMTVNNVGPSSPEKDRFRLGAIDEAHVLFREVRHDRKKRERKPKDEWWNRPLFTPGSGGGGDDASQERVDRANTRGYTPVRTYAAPPVVEDTAEVKAMKRKAKERLEKHKRDEAKDVAEGKVKNV